MPIYEYCCKDCHQVFEEWSKQIVDDNATCVCPICKGKSERIVSNTSFVLKGGGWYTTDYGYKKGLNEHGATTGSESPATSAPDTASAVPAPAPAAGE